MVLQRKAPAQQLFGQVVIALAHGDGRARRAARGHQRRKGRNDHDQRQAHAHARQRQAAVARHVADVNAVYNVIQHVHQLRHDCGHRQLNQQLADGLRAQEGFILRHK